METILITGGTGLIGTALSEALLEKGYRVVVLTRHATETPRVKGVATAAWDPVAGTIDETAISEADHIIHLAGANVASKRWTEKRKKEIVDSRVATGHLLVDALQRIPNHVKTVVSASAIGWYGPDNNNGPFVESDPSAPDFLGQTCLKWEASLAPVPAMGKRLVQLRTGIVLSKKGGALREFIKPLKFGFAAILGNGRQVISWIHIDDLVNMYLFAVTNEKLNGVYNAVAPNPVTNRMLTITLAKSRGRFYIPVHVPAFVLKMMLGEMSIEVLKSATVSNEKIRDTGFAFRFPSIQMALEQ